jgi:hypothetical protein
MKYLIQSLNVKEVGHLVEFTVENSKAEDTEDRYVELVIEIPYYIEHWDNYELKLFYEWVYLINRFIPINFELLVDQWIKERKEQIGVVADILNQDFSCIEDVEDYNKCLTLLSKDITKNREKV